VTEFEAYFRADRRRPDARPGADRRAATAARFRRVRDVTERLMAPLLPDDFRIQSMPDVSPPYWNLGHTSWFFATNVLQRFDRMHAAGRRLRVSGGFADRRDARGGAGRWLEGTEFHTGHHVRAFPSTPSQVDRDR
jgi:hypothetical protein